MSTVEPLHNTAASRFTPALLLRPSAFPHAVTALEVRETHVAWVILTGPYAYKIKKNVKLEFIDSSTLERRQALCEDEVRLNRRLAADLYVDVVAITQSDGEAQIGGSGTIIEYAVRMIQFEASQELSALLAARAVSVEDLVNLAKKIAQFHESAPKAHCTEEFRHTSDLHDAVLGNLATLLAHLDGEMVLPELNLLIDWTHDYLHESLVSLRMREKSGAVRECHGDLHARNVVRWRGRLTPFDCLEFDPRLRWIDVINDVAFLTMDLMSRGRRDLACVFLNTYLEHTGDYDGARHISFYCVYRAMVRAMVDGLGAENDASHRKEYRDRFRARVRSAAAHVARPAPVLILMHGLSGSGKSQLSEALIPLLGAVRIRSDVERKRLARDHKESAFLYDPEMNRLTYARLLVAAESCLAGGLNVIVDSAFLKAGDRRAFRDLAKRMGVRLLILACEAKWHVLTARIEARTALGRDPSDADAAVLAQQILDREPLDLDELTSTVLIETESPQAIQTAYVEIRNRLTLE